MTTKLSAVTFGFLWRIGIYDATYIVKEGDQDKLSDMYPKYSQTEIEVEIAEVGEGTLITQRGKLQVRAIFEQEGLKYVADKFLLPPNNNEDNKH